MNKKTIFDILKATIFILLILGAALALRAPAEDLNILPTDIRGQYVDSSGLPYFSEMDSYFNLRLTENYVDHGYAGDIIVNGTEMDMHRLAPDGTPMVYEMGIIYLTSFLFDVSNYFGSYSLKEVAFWTGAFISCLAAIPAYIFSRRITNDYGAIVATTLIVLAPNYFAHTFPGFFDTDMFYFIFPLFFIFFFIESMMTNKWLYKIIFAILSVISIGLFSISWTGYIFYIGVMGVFVVAYLLLNLFLNKGIESKTFIERIKSILHTNEFLSIGIILLLGIISLSIFQGIDAITSIFDRLIGLLSLQAAARGIAFPNVLVSVAEMQIPVLISGGVGGAFLANNGGVINGIGGMIILFAVLIVLYSFVLKIWKLKSNKIEINGSDKKLPKSERISASKKLDETRQLSSGFMDFFSLNEDNESKKSTLIYATLFITWILVCIVAVTQGSRFITTLVLPTALITGIFVGYTSEFVKSKVNNDNWLMIIAGACAFLTGFPIMQINMTLGMIVLVIIVALAALLIYGLPKQEYEFNNIPLKKYLVVFAICFALMSPTVSNAYMTANSVIPGTNDAMWDSMVWINQNSPEDTVIISWWDFGYLFEIAADRQVTFDGGTQSGERAFWLGQAMTTDNLELSAGIFRMLNTEGGRAVEYLNNISDGDTDLSTTILIETLPLAKEEAKQVMMDKYKLSAGEADQTLKYSHPDNPRPTIFVASSDMLQKAGWWTYFGNWNFDNQNSTNYQYLIANQEFIVEENSKDTLTLFEESGLLYNVVVERGAGNNTTNGYTEAIIAKNGSELVINGSVFNPLEISRLIVVEDGYLVKNQTMNSTDGNYTLLLMVNGNYVSPILMSNELENSMFSRLYLFGGGDQNIFKNVHMEVGVSLWEVQFENTVAGGGGTSTTTTNSSK